MLYHIDPKKIRKVNENYLIDDSDYDEMKLLEFVELGPEYSDYEEMNRLKLVELGPEYSDYEEMNRLELVELGPEWKVVVGDKRSIHTAIEKRQYKCIPTPFF